MALSLGSEIIGSPIREWWNFQMAHRIARHSFFCALVRVVYFCSAMVSVQLANSTTKPHSVERKAPKLTSEASVADDLHACHNQLQLVVDNQEHRENKACCNAVNTDC